MQEQRYQVAATLPLLVLEMRFAIEARALLNSATAFGQSLTEEDRARFTATVEQFLNTTDTNQEIAILGCWADNSLVEPPPLLSTEDLQRSFWGVVVTGAGDRGERTRRFVNGLPDDYRRENQARHLASVIANRYAPAVRHGDNLYQRYALSRTIRNRIVHADHRPELQDPAGLLQPPWLTPTRVLREHAEFVRTMMFDFVDFLTRVHFRRL